MSTSGEGRFLASPLGLIRLPWPRTRTHTITMTMLRRGCFPFGSVTPTVSRETLPDLAARFRFTRSASGSDASPVPEIIVPGERLPVDHTVA